MRVHARARRVSGGCNVGSGSGASRITDTIAWHTHTRQQRDGPAFKAGEHLDKGRCISLSRRQFWEVFTDFEVVCGREWLSLPLDHFYLFQDHDGDERVDAVEVLMVLALFCRADPEDALTFCFEVFDGDGSNIMELVRVLCAARWQRYAPAPLARAQTHVALLSLLLCPCSPAGRDGALSVGVGVCGVQDGAHRREAAAA